MADVRLPGPYEILDLPDGGMTSFRVRSWAKGLVDITPKRQTAIKTIEALRVIVQSGDKPMGPSYWDVTSKLLIVHLLEEFKRPDVTRLRFTIKKFGVAPTARFSVEVKPL